MKEQHQHHHHWNRTSLTWHRHRRRRRQAINESKRQLHLRRHRRRPQRTTRQRRRNHNCCPLWMNQALMAMIRNSSIDWISFVFQLLLFDSLLSNRIDKDRVDQCTFHSTVCKKSVESNRTKEKYHLVLMAIEKALEKSDSHISIVRTAIQHFHPSALCQSPRDFPLNRIKFHLQRHWVFPIVREGEGEKRTTRMGRFPWKVRQCLGSKLSDRKGRKRFTTRWKMTSADSIDTEETLPDLISPKC